MREQDSVAAYLVKAALHGIQDSPERVAAVLHQAGIDPALLEQDDARLPATAVSSFWLAMDAELNDEFFGFDSHGLPSGSFALICRALIQEPTLAKALAQCFKYLGFFIHDIRGSLELRNGQAVICLDSSMDKQALKGAAEEIYLSIVLGVMCWLIGRRIPLNRARFSTLAPSLEATPWHWGPLVEFECPRTEVSFDASYLKLPVIQDQAALRSFLRSCPQWLVVRFRNNGGIASKVFRRLRSQPSSEWPTLKELAQELRLSEQMLRRQLAREGFTYQAIKHEVRRAIAFALLSDKTISISEIAVQAGFQEPSAFHRIFRRWTGESPGQFRQRLWRD
ncbi:AraC family transcriptional regulator [Pseudomonas sp. 5P_3.1_Bac2]|uniref:AraC family transcriptional regulator n=1 Tax=Pseudomonas sp. 5P_3.1_Bac2 TaxID=2971617 RepID=UPI0021C8C89F|nr:AraC family transcriptional regulator [Pseudomonas sp. 5P_3.1_Bac2]MCU1719032.1 AraC family transcriptional regulator [Pseudomonas sp. 5P_3.1_Bac2]